jgi:hypothetical protein
MNGLGYLRPELTRRLAALDAAEAGLGPRIPPVYEVLDRDLARSVLKTYVAWLGRTEEALAPRSPHARRRPLNTRPGNRV